MSLRVLSIRQPWAYAILAGWKDVENRSWGTQRRGPIAIHTGQLLDVNYETVWPEGQEHPPVLDALPTGRIVGVVDVVDVVMDSPSPWAQPGARHWVLANPREIPEPITHSGALGLLELDPAVVHQIEQQLGEVFTP